MDNKKLVKGLVTDPDYYDGIVGQMIDANRDSKGNVIDADKDKEICEVLRQAIYKVGIPTKEVAIDYIEGYKKQDNEVVLNFIDITVRFINAVTKDNLDKYLVLWKREYKKAIDNTKGLHEVVVTNIADWNYEYIKGLFEWSS